MAESSSYFEAHRHVLQALQRTDGQSIPFGKTLSNCTQTVDPPSYLLPPDGSHMDARGDYDRYDFAHVLPQIHSSDSHGPSHLRVLKPWPKWTAPPPGDGSGAGAGAGASGPAKPSSDNSDTTGTATTSTMDYHLDEPDGCTQTRLNKGGRDYTGGARYRQDKLTQLALSLILKNARLRDGARPKVDAHADPHHHESNRSLDALLEGILPCRRPKVLSKGGRALRVT